MAQKSARRAAASNGGSKTSSRTAGPRKLVAPVFAQPEPTADPTLFKIKHPSDAPAYRAIDRLNSEHRLGPTPFPRPRGRGPEPRLTLREVFGDRADLIEAIEQRRQITFHATGDCGSTRGPKTQNEVVDKMHDDFTDTDPREIPQFCLLLGDIVYSFGEPQYYYDQFYDPYRSYPAPILAAAGNHDGMISPLAGAKSLDAYLRNFCADPADGYRVTAEAGGLSRTAQIQPGVFFTFDAPFVRILVLYSNTLEDPGVIAGPTIGDSQLGFLEAALRRVKAEGYEGALLFAHHHPPYTWGSRHSSSVDMRRQMDAICAKVGVWPHAVLSGHSHNYQRFTRHRPDGTEIPYVVCGNGGHALAKLHPKGGVPPRAPQIVQPMTTADDQITLEGYDDTSYGYLRVIANPRQLRVEYHPAKDGDRAKTPGDSVTIDLVSRRQASYQANDLGAPASAASIRARRSSQAQAERRSSPAKPRTAKSSRGASKSE